MRSQYIYFPEPHRATLETEKVSPDDLGQGEALIKGRYSIISAGTELASFTDVMGPHPDPSADWPPPYPRRTGYGLVGEVVAVGPDCGDLAPGNLVLTLSDHCSVVRANSEILFPKYAVRIPPDMDLRQAVCARMAGVGITAMRASSVAAGDDVVVIGLGLVGNFAAQFMHIAGARVMGVDLSPLRLEAAQRCGILYVANPNEVDLRQTVWEWTGGRGAAVVIEATGRSEVVPQAVQVAARFGEVVLLGSPRASASYDPTPMLLGVNGRTIRMVGAFEWSFPLAPAERSRFSINENMRQIIGWLCEGRLVVDPLITHVLSPVKCQQAYDGLLRQKNEYLGVIFDWSAIT